MNRGDPHGLIEETAVRMRRRRLWSLCLPALPPLAALLGAYSLGVLPVELAAAGAIAFVLLGLHLGGVELSPTSAARFLDDALRAKDHFLTLATARANESLLPVVAAEAAALAGSPPELPSTNRRPLWTSFLLSAAAVIVLWSLPHLPSPAVADGNELERIAAELAEAGDASLASVLRDVARTLRDPHRANEEKLEKIAAAVQRIEQAERERMGGQGNSRESAGGGEGQRGKAKQEGGGEGGEGVDAGGRSGTGGSRGGTADAGTARSQAKQELERLAGQRSGEASKAKAGQQSQQGEKAETNGAGIQGPENGAKERKQSERDGTANQPGKDPNQSGSDETTGADPDRARAERGQQDRQPNQAGAATQGGGGADASGRRSTSQSDKQAAERFYKPGEGSDGKIVGGQYVRIRVPDEAGELPGTEIVAKPGDATPRTPYGNAPLPSLGAPGEIAADQPVPLEYRKALKGTTP